MSALLEIDRLDIELPRGSRRVPVVHDVSFEIAAGEAVGLVGESGSGKSMTTRAIMRLLPRGARQTGAVRFDGRSIPDMDRRQLRRWRATDVAMVFQDPRAHINPVRTVGDFLVEGLVVAGTATPMQARRHVAGLLREVGIHDPERRMRQRPHELSGGLLQRVMIAGALAVEPRLLLADEPTTALDVTTQEEVMAILAELRAERGLALLFVTHDLDLAAAVCDRTAVMYAGTVVETRPSRRLAESASHPYTRGLMASRPVLGSRSDRLQAIEGRPLSAFEVTAGCPFASRCRLVTERCRVDAPHLRELDGGWVACHRAEEVASATGRAGSRA